MVAFYSIGKVNGFRIFSYEKEREKVYKNYFVSERNGTKPKIPGMNCLFRPIE